jgi:hypothetical protein
MFNPGKNIFGAGRLVYENMGSGSSEMNQKVELPVPTTEKVSRAIETSYGQILELRANLDDKVAPIKPELDRYNKIIEEMNQERINNA